MLKRLVIVSLILCFNLQMGWAGVYDVEYLGGHPGLADDSAKGILRVDHAGVTFEAKDGQTFVIPHSAILQQFKLNMTTTTRMGMLGFAGPNPIVMAATLGASILGNVLSKPRVKNGFLYRIHAQESHKATAYEVTFKVPDSLAQNAIVVDVRTAGDTYTAHVNQQPLPSHEETLEDMTEVTTEVVTSP